MGMPHIGKNTETLVHRCHTQRQKYPAAPTLKPDDMSCFSMSNLVKHLWSVLQRRSPDHVNDPDCCLYELLYNINTLVIKCFKTLPADICAFCSIYFLPVSCTLTYSITCILTIVGIWFHTWMYSHYLLPSTKFSTREDLCFSSWP